MLCVPQFYKSASRQGLVDSLSVASQAANSLAKSSEQVAQMLPRAEQALGTFETTAQRGSEALEQVTKTTAHLGGLIQSAAPTLDRIGEAAGLASSVLEKMNIAMTPIQLMWNDIDLVPVMIKISRVVANCALARKSCMVASLLLNVASEFGSDLVAMLRNWLFTPTQVEEAVEMDEYRAAHQQMIDLSDVAVFMNVQQWLSEHTAMTVTTVAVAIFGMLHWSLGLPSSSLNTEATLKFFGERCRHMKSMVDFMKSSWKLFEDMATWLIESIFPGVVKHGLEEYINGYHLWAKEVLSLVRADAPVSERVKTDKKLIFRISHLYRKGMQFSVQLNRLKVPEDLRDHFQKTFKLIEAFLKMADKSGALGNRPRMKPYIIQMFGESGVGKSGMLMPLCGDLNAVFCESADEAKDFAEQVYFRNAEQEFWDGYSGQRVCVWDDFGQLTDTSANPNPEFFEIIRAGNSAPYPLHMADLPEKARTKFVSAFCLLTSNVVNQKISSITFPSAMRRRIDLLVEVKIKPEFAKEGTNIVTGETVMRLDPTKCNGGADTRVYEFTLCNAETLQPICKEDGETLKMDYDELLDHILQHSQKNFEQSLNFNESIDDRLTEERHQKLRKTFLGRNPFNNLGRKPATEQIFGFWSKSAPETDSDWVTDDEEESETPVFEPQPDVEEVDEYDPIDWDIVEQNKYKHLLLKLVPEDLREVNFHRIAAQVPRLKVSWLQIFYEQLKKWLGIKHIFATIGVILGGLGVWKIFELLMPKTEEQDTLEFSVPNSDEKVKVLVREAACSGDQMTRNAKKITVEASTKRSKLVSRALRHEILAAPAGWVKIAELLEHLKVHDMSREELAQVVMNDDKNRFEFGPDDCIRATQGHSYEIDPTQMYPEYKGRFASHFTYVRCLKSIQQNGIKRMGRALVHMHPGHLTQPTMNLPNRNAVVWLDLAQVKSFMSSNGYVLAEDIPASAIVEVKTISKEASCSGDSLTARAKKVTTEASVSGDCRTNHAKKATVEQLGLNKDNTTPEKYEEATLQAWKDKAAQDLISHRILGNLYRILVDGRECLNGLFVRDTIMLTVEHLLPHLRNGKNITIRNMFGSEFTIPTADVKVQVLTDSTGRSKDAMLIQFPRHVNSHSDLVKHFQTMPELAEKKAEVCLPTITKLGERYLFKILCNSDAQFMVSHVIFNGKPHDIRDSIQYRLNTTGGDCGSPIIVNEPSFLRKIAGIHIAGFDDGSAAIGQSVTRKDLETAMKSWNWVVVDHDELPFSTIKPISLQMATDYSTEDFKEKFDMPADTFGYIGVVTKSSSPPMNSDLRRSVLHGKVVTPTTKPALLRHNEVNLIHRNVEKCAINCPYIPQVEVDRAVAEVRALLLSGESRSRLAKVLTFEEAVAGSPISDYVDGIKRQSSPGFPHVFDRKAEHPGKTTWFGKDEWKFDEQVRDLVELRIDFAKKGKRFATIWSDTLKDERRPIAKVDALKTRVFAHGPMDYTIAFRMYFLGFIAHIMENRIDNEQSLGTNPFGSDWTKTARHLGRFGDKVFAGDFSQFDGTLNSCIMKEFAKLANQFYNDGKENAIIRETLMLEIFNSIHLCSGKLIQLTHSQPSGNPLTTVLNSFYNSVSMRIAYYRCFDGKAPPFSENVSMVSYGDDNVVNFSEQVSERFNQNTVTEAYASFGMIYTDEAKTFGEIAPWRKISEVNYLKRGFRLEDGRWMAPLSLETILESTNWVRKCTDEVGACVQNCQTAFRELSHHPQSVFDEWSTKIFDAVLQETNVAPVCLPRIHYLDDESPSW